MFLLGAAVCGCEGGSYGDGYVYSKKTGMPIENAVVQQFLGRDGRSTMEDCGITTTDSLGHYECDTKMYGCLGNCSKWKLVARISNGGSDTIEVERPNGDTVFLD